MPSDAESGPRRFLLAIMAVSLLLLVPLMFLLVTLVGRVVEPHPAGDAINGWMIVWALLALVLVALVIGAAVIIARGTQQAQLEHEPPGAGDHRLP